MAVWHRIAFDRAWSPREAYRLTRLVHHECVLFSVLFGNTCLDNRQIMLIYSDNDNILCGGLILPRNLSDVCFHAAMCIV